MKQEKNVVIINFILICFYWLVLSVVLTIDKGDKNMSDVIVVGIIGGCTTILAAVITGLFARKTKLDNITKTVNGLIDKIGVDKEETLTHKLTSQYNVIIDDIGRDKGSSLSVQHQEILDEVNKNYSEIKSRYDKQDESYRRFTTEQYDLKQTLDNFARNYTEVINNEQKLYIENCELKDANSLLQKDIEKLQHQNQELKVQNNQLINVLNQEQAEEEFER